MTIVNDRLVFVAESYVYNAAGFQDLMPGIAVIDCHQAADMTFTIVSHVLVWYRNGCGTNCGTYPVFVLEMLFCAFIYVS